MAAEPYVPKRRVYRRDAHRLIIAGLYLVPAALFLVAALYVHPAWALGSVPWLVLAWLTLRIGVYPSSDGVLVRNVLRSRRIRWDEIDRFGWGDWWGFSIGGVYLVDGTFVRVFALNPPFEIERGQSPAVPRALDGLNEERERAQAGWLTSSP